MSARGDHREQSTLPLRLLYTFPLGEGRNLRSKFRGGVRDHWRALRSGHQRGFTLLEVLVAIAILSLSLGVIFGIFSQSIARTEANAGEAEARTLAQSLMERTRAEPPANASGVTDDGFVWRVEVAPYGSDEDRAAWSKDLEQVTVRVSWPGNLGSTRTLSLTTLRLAPKAPTS